MTSFFELFKFMTSTKDEIEQETKREQERLGLKQTEKGLELNFGPSDYSRWAPGIPKKDNIVRIPEKEGLPKIAPKFDLRKAHQEYPHWVCYPWADRNESGTLVLYLSQEFEHITPVKTIVGDTATVTVTKLPGGPGEETKEIILPWIEARGEWIVIYKTKWCETDGLYDELYYGPFALDEMCVGKILEAYGVPKGKFTTEEVSRMSPERLKQNSQSPQ